jgi:hypothetical protein
MFRFYESVPKSHKVSLLEALLAMSWGSMPQMFHDQVDSDAAGPAAGGDVDNIMGEAGERSDSARERVARPREAAEAAPVDNPIVGDDPGKKAKKRQKAPLASKLLRKMQKKSHADHAHAEFTSTSTEGDDRLHCDACGYDFSAKANVREKHWKSEGHKEAVVARRAKAKKVADKQQTSIERSMAGASSAAEARRVKGVAVSEHRMRVMRALMERGIPFDVLDGDLLELLEEPREHRIDLGHKSNLARDFMASQSKAMWEQLRAEHKGVAVALAFDSTPWNDDIALVVSRWCTVDFHLQHRLVALKCFAGSLKAAHWVHIIGDVINKLDLPRESVRVGLTDGCNVMVKAGRDLEEELPDLIALRCLPHFWQKVPGMFGFGEVGALLAAWNAVFKNSHVARVAFKKVAKEKWARKHKIRWNAAHVQHRQVMDHYTELRAIVDRLKLKGACKKALPTLERLLQNEQLATSNLAVAVTVQHDAALPFVTITKFLEGNGFLAPFVMTRIGRVRSLLLT